MRILLMFAIGFGGACLLCAYLYFPWILPAAILCLLVCGVLFLLKEKHTLLRILLVVVFGLAMGFGWFSVYDSLYVEPIRPLHGTDQTLDIEVLDYPEETSYGCGFSGLVRIHGIPYRVYVYLDQVKNLVPGNLIHGRFHMTLTTHGGDMTYLGYQSDGIYLRASALEDPVIHTTEPSWYHYPMIWRGRLIAVINASIPEDASGFARALLLGDKSGIDYKTDTDFAVSGIKHIIAVSGLHVSILFGLVYILTAKRRFLTFLIGTPIVLIFAAVAGFSPSVMRASVMQLLIMVSMMSRREYDSATSLSFAALVLMFINPFVCTSVSFQLSFACMAGIFLLSGRIYRWLTDPNRFAGTRHPLVRWLAGSVSATLGAFVFTMPLCAIYFGLISLVGVITNLMTLWVVTFVFYGVMLVCFFGILIPGVGAFLGSILAWPIRYILTVASLMADVPLAAIYLQDVYILIWVLGTYLLLAAYILLRRKPSRLLICLLVLGILVASGFSWLEPLTSDCVVTMVDVGQGQAVIVQAGGKTFLVDCGGDYDESAAEGTAHALLSRGVSRLDGIIVTHLDRDHCGGIPYLLTQIPADMLILPYVPDHNGMALQLQKSAGNGISYVKEFTKLSFDGCEITIYPPIFMESSNESGLAVLLQTEKCDILVTGDRSELTELYLLQYDLPKLEVLVAGHHGAKDSTSTALLEATRPEYVLISAGRNNRYGHPAPETLSRIAEFGSIVYSTATHGTIVFRR